MKKLAFAPLLALILYWMYTEEDRTVEGCAEPRLISSFKVFEPRAVRTMYRYRCADGRSIDVHFSPSQVGEIK